jgi:hypothetical protein
VDNSPLKSVWLVPPVVIGLFYIHTAWSWFLGGVIALVVGTLVAADYRGVAARIPRAMTMNRMGQMAKTPGGVRRSFAAVAAWGVVMILLALR